MSPETTEKTFLKIPIKKFTIKVDGFFKFFSSSYGAVMTFPIMAFNGLTTVNGAGIILPPAIGDPLGGFLSFVYFTIVVSPKISRKRKKTTSLLIFLFWIASTYTSFFSIYKQLSNDSDPLANQAKEEAIDNHELFLTEFRQTLARQIKKIDNDTSKYNDLKAEDAELKREIDLLTEKRKEHEANRAIPLAGDAIQQITKKRVRRDEIKREMDRIKSDSEINRQLITAKSLNDINDILNKDENELNEEKASLIKNSSEVAVTKASQSDLNWENFLNKLF